MMVKLILFLIASHPYSDSIVTNRSEFLAQKAQSEIFAFHYLYTQCFQGMDPRTESGRTNRSVGHTVAESIFKGL